MTTKLINSQNVSILKKRAKRLKTSNSIPHHQALEVVASESGFSSWHEVCEANQPFLALESSLKHGFIAIYDRKDAESFHDSKNRFVEDGLGELVCEKRLYQHYINLIDEDRGVPLKELMEESQLMDDFHGTYSHTYLRYLPEKPPATVHDALSMLREFMFFLPEFIILNGQLYDMDADETIAQTSLIQRL